MRSRPTPEHQQAVARRLALLSAELAAARPVSDPVPPDWDDEPVGGTAGVVPDDAEDWTAPHTRIPALRVVPPPPAAVAAEDGASDPAEPATVPVPGRHAARRRGRTPGGRVGSLPGPPPGSLVASVVPDGLRGWVVLGPPQVAVLAVLVALGLAITCWWVVRGEARQVEAPVVPSPAAGLVAASPSGLVDEAVASRAAGPGAGAAEGSVTVDVAGKVRHPGIAVLDAGARVVDALKAAGGARPGVDLSGLNLARPLVDGEQILVGVPAAVGVAASTAASPGAPAGPLVNLNTATQADLEALPEVGPVTAQSILAWRDEHGGFTAVDELLEVDGIGDATLAKLAPLVTV